jgi:hypothetical protein
MSANRATAFAYFAVVALTGCAPEPTDEEVLASAQSAALSTNALSTNALSTNALSTNALSTKALAAIQDPGATGALSRELLQYIAGCALTPTQSISFSWTDAGGVTHDEMYRGQLGLAAEWADGPLTRRSSQDLVSACLAARTNYFGIPVHLSMRGGADVLADNTTSAELAAYPYVEGAFWGNLFTATPRLYACYDPSNVAHAWADERVCATGYPTGHGQFTPCGIIALTGSCEDRCRGFDRRGQYYRGCGDDASQHSITIGLQ